MTPLYNILGLGTLQPHRAGGKHPSVPPARPFLQPFTRAAISCRGWAVFLVHGGYLIEDGQKHAHHIWSFTPLYTFPGLGLPPALQPGCHTKDGQWVQYLDLPAPLLPAPFGGPPSSAGSASRLPCHSMPRMGSVPR